MGAGARAGTHAGAGAGATSTVAEATHSFVGQTDQTLVVEAGALHAAGSTDYFLKDLTGCVVVIRTVLSALKMENLKVWVWVYEWGVAGCPCARAHVWCPAQVRKLGEGTHPHHT